MGESLSKRIDTFFMSSEEIISESKYNINNKIRSIKRDIAWLEYELSEKMESYDEACANLRKSPNMQMSMQEFRFTYTIPIVRIKQRLHQYNKHLTKLTLALSEISSVNTEMSLIDTTDNLNTVLQRKYSTPHAVYAYQVQIEKARLTREVVQDMVDETYNENNIENEISNEEALLLESSNYFPPELIRPNKKQDQQQDTNADNISLPSAPVNVI